MKNFKVIQVIDSLRVGGAETVAVNIANALSENNIKSYLCTTRKEGLLKNNLNDNVEYLFLKRKKIIDVSAILKLKKYIKQNNISIIHAHSSSYFIAICIKILYPKVIIIWHHHNGDSEFLNHRKAFPLNIFSILFSRIIVVNNNLQLWASEKLFCKNIFVINNFAAFKNIDKITTLKGAKDYRIVCLAGFRTQKDHLTLLKAFKLLVKQSSNWTLHLVGKDYKDNYANLIHNFIHANNLTNNVFRYGVCSDIRNILKQATIGVLSSESEALPVSLLEYGLAKLPVVCTDVGACSSIIAHGVSGYIVPPHNFKEFAHYLIKLATSKEDKLKFGLSLNKNVISNYSKEAIIKSVIEVYNNCLYA